MMKRLGFDDKWIKWIKMCLESATYSILDNGSLTKEFKSRRGLRQGDSLAPPFLFLIVGEGLTGLVHEARGKNLLEGEKVGGKGVNIDLLQFANDILLFCQPTYGNILTFKAILMTFELVSGLKVKFHKIQVRL